MHKSQENGGKKMEKRILKRLLCLIVGSCLLLGNVLTVGAAEPFDVIGNVKPSKTDYVVELESVGNTFIGNKTPVEMTVGKRFCLVYTVAEVEQNELWQNGLTVTSDNTKEYVFNSGTMHYEFVKDKLLEVGSTYFIRYEMTADGLSYIAAKVNKDGEAAYLEFKIPVSNKYEGNQYFGLWFGSNGGRLSAKLTQVLCYDEAGNDLGINVNAPQGGATIMNYDLLTELDVPHHYEFSLKDAVEVAISNERGTKSDTVFMSYTVKNVEKNLCSQTGGTLTTSPDKQFPHGSTGLLNFNFCKEGEGSSLLHEGSHYLVRFDRNNGDFKVSVKETTSSGKTNYFGFSLYYGNYHQDAEYFSLWFGESASRPITADFVDFKCYDASGKNLAVQFNRDGVNVRHFGNLEDYTLCEGVYYALSNDTFLILDDECNMGRQIDEEGQDTVWGTYVINGDKLTMTMDNKIEEYTYLYENMTDKDGVKYIRLGDAKVSFVTGDKNEEGNTIVTVTAADGYKVQQPEKPSLKGLTFKEWCMGDGTVYDFDSVVTKSITLYAKYVDGDGHEYLSVDGPVNGISSTTIISIGVSSLLVLITIVICILAVKKVKKHG